MNEEKLKILSSLDEYSDKKLINSLLEHEHPADIADFASRLSPNDIIQVILSLDNELKSDVFAHLDYDIQAKLATLMSREELGIIFSALSPDDRANAFRELPDDVRDKILPALAYAEREDIRKLSQYAENSAGSVMTSDYVTLHENISVKEALDNIRVEAPDKETIYYCYITDSQRKLTGFVSLKDLILAAPEQLIKDIIEDVMSVNVVDDQEEVARKMQKYDLLAIPVVNNENIIVGIITYDDALDIIIEEQTEDIEKIMAISGDPMTGGYLRTPSWIHFKKRVGWVIFLAALSLISGYIIHSFESALTGMIILAIYMPMMADTGGNTGSQSASMVIRALALKEVKAGDFVRVVLKELSVSGMLAIILAVLAFAKVLLITDAGEVPAGFSITLIGVAISLALAIQVISSTLIGALLPLIASKLKLDPAVVASPALTTIVDITGLLIYFTVIRLMFGL